MRLATLAPMVLIACAPLPTSDAAMRAAIEDTIRANGCVIRGSEEKLLEDGINARIGGEPVSLDAQADLERLLGENDTYGRVIEAMVRDGTLIVLPDDGARLKDCGS